MRRSIICIVLAIAVIGGVVVYRFSTHSSKTAAPNPIHHTSAQQTASKPKPVAAFNKAQFSTDTPSSPWLVVNKTRPLNPKDYAPSVTVPNVALRLGSSDGEMHVSTAMAPSLEKLFADAQAAGVPMRLASGYRSYQLQVSVYNAEVQNYGQAVADSESARPGYSEHQTGLAVDLEPFDRSCEVTDCFGQTPQGKWLAANAYKYGFIIRYTPDKVAVTGYRPEPWHIRYVGSELSTELHNTHIETLEEFFGLPAAPDY